MQSYKQAFDQSGLESWPAFEDEGVEVIADNPQQAGRINWGVDNAISYHRAIEGAIKTEKDRTA